MSRRFPTSRRPALESLEIRCNPAALVPIAASLIEPAPVENGNLQIADLTSVAIDPISLNAFAGQTVRIRFEAADASTAFRTAGSRLAYNDDIGASQSAGGGGFDVLVGGAGRDTLDAQSGGISKLGSQLLLIQGDSVYAGNHSPPNASIEDLIVDPSNRDTVYLGGAREDILIAGTTAYDSESTGFDDNNHGTHVAGTIGAVGNNGVVVVPTSTSDGSVRFIKDTVDITALAADDSTASQAGVNYNTVCGKVTAIAVDESDRTGNTYYSQLDLESIIDVLARDVASRSRSDIASDDDPAATDIVLSSVSPDASGIGVATAQLNLVGTVRDL